MIDENKGNQMTAHILRQYLTFAYQEMAQDKVREDEANEWCEGLVEDVILTS